MKHFICNYDVSFLDDVAAEQKDAVQKKLKMPEEFCWKNSVHHERDSEAFQNFTSCKVLTERLNLLGMENDNRL
jgi:hypothetical protein